MGYYTDYKLSISNYDDEKLIEKVQKQLEKISHYDWINFGSYLELHQCKWYENDLDMRKLSKKYPKIMFFLDGQGEEGLPWKAYYQNGKGCVLEPKLVYPEFTEDMLK